MISDPLYLSGAGDASGMCPDAICTDSGSPGMNPGHKIGAGSSRGGSFRKAELPERELANSGTVP